MRGSIWGAGALRGVAMLVAAVLPLGAAGLALVSAPAAQAATPRAGTPLTEAAATGASAGPRAASGAPHGAATVRMHSRSAEITTRPAVRQSPTTGICTVTGNFSEGTPVYYGFETAEQFTMTMRPTSGGICLLAPTGTVTVSTPGKTLCTMTLSNSPGSAQASGACNISTNTLLAVGGYTVSASYSGDLEYAPAESSQPLGISQQSTTTSLTLSQPGSIFGQEQSETMSVQVSPQAEGTPTGTVVLTESSTTLCTIPLSSGKGSCSLSSSQLPVGTYSIIATYGGDAEFSGSASAAQSLIVGTDHTVTSLDENQDGATYGREQTTTWSVSVLAQTGTPTGTVTVTAGSYTLCTITLSAGAGSCATGSTAAPVGTYTVTATYNGNSSFVPSSDSFSTWQVGQSHAYPTLSLSASTVTYGNEHTELYSVTVAPEFVGTPTGTVTVEDTSNDTLCTLTLSAGKGSCSSGDTAVSAGSYQLFAAYNGDTNFSALTSSGSPQSLTVSQATTVTQIGESAGPFTYGSESAVEFTTYVLPQYGGTPTGTVDVETADNQVLCTINLTPGQADAVGFCFLSDTVAPPGMFTVRGVYSSDTNFATEPSNDESLTIGQDGSTTQLGLSAASVGYGGENAETFSATVAPQYAAAGTPTGTVTVAESGTTLCTITLAAGTGSCSMAASQLPTGNYQVTGSYNGDQNTATSTSSPAQGLTVTTSTSTTALALSSASVTYGKEQAGKFTVTVSSASPGTPTGTVTVAESGTTLCTITLASGTGSCSMGAKKLPAGKYNVSATYGGDSTFAVSSSPVSKLSVAREGSTTKLKLSASAVTFGRENAEHVTVQVRPQYPSAVTGQVRIKAKEAGHLRFQVCLIKLKSGAGSCVLPVRAMRPGSYELVALYYGSTDILTSSSAEVSLRVKK
jgi:large repetitive protein